MSSLIVITRPGTAGQRLQQALESQGIVSLHLPGLMLTGIDLPDEMPQSISQADWWLFTSPAAIAYTSHWLLRLNQKSGPAFKRYPKIAVLSEKSAQQLKDTLMLDDQTTIIWPDNGHRSESLLRHPKLQQLDNQQIIIFNAPGGRRLLADTLKRRAARVELFPVYNRQAAALDSSSLQQLDNWSGSTLALWTSNTAIDNLHRQLSKPLWQKLMSGDHLSLSIRQKNALEKVCTGKIYLAHAPDNTSLQQQLVQLST